MTDSLSLPDIGPEMSVIYPRPAGKGLEVVRLLAPGRSKGALISMRERGVYSVRYGWADVTETAGAKMGTIHEEQLFSLCPLLWCYLVALAEIKCQYVLDFD